MFFSWITRLERPFRSARRKRTTFRLERLEDRTVPSHAASGVATHLLLEAPKMVQAGHRVNVLVEALDASNHPVTNFTGTVHLTGNTPHGKLSTAFSFRHGDHGKHMVNLPVGTTGKETITATVGTTHTIKGTLALQVTPAATHLGIIVLPYGQSQVLAGLGCGDNGQGDDQGSGGSVYMGVATSFEVVALDAGNQVVPGYTGTVHFTSTDSSTTVPADYTFQASDNGTHVFTFTPGATGTETLTGTDTATSSITGNVSVQVTPAPVADHLAVVVVPYGQKSGVPAFGGWGFGLGRHEGDDGGEDNGFGVPVYTGVATSFEVVALSANNQLVPNYTGTVHFTSMDSSTVVPADYTFVAGDQGSHLFTFTPGTASTDTLTATDTTTSSITGSVSLQVSPAPVATHLAVLVVPYGQGSGFAGFGGFGLGRHEGGDDDGDGGGSGVQVYTGVPTSFEVVALDASNQLVPNYTGTVHFTSVDSSTVVPADYTFVAGDQGSHLFTFTPGTASTDTLTATDAATSSVTGSVSLQVSPAPVATQFDVRVERHTQTGQPASVVVTALDANGNLVPNYTGTVQLTSTNSSDELVPVSYTFTASDQGSHAFQVTFAANGSDTLTVTDTANSSLTGSSTVQVGQSDQGWGWGDGGQGRHHHHHHGD